jgi:predicted ATPase
MRFMEILKITMFLSTAQWFKFSLQNMACALQSLLLDYLTEHCVIFVCLRFCVITPPPLVCIEEPELGLYLDVLPELAELMKSASTKCQLIVTTHSEVLVDALTDTPESVLI